MGSVHCPSSTSVHEKKQRLLPRTQTVQLRTREMRRFTTTETTTATITNGSVVALGGGYTTPHATLRAALRRLYPLDCDAGPMNGDNNIIQLPKDKGL